MRTAFATDTPRKTALLDLNAPLTVAISAGSASVRARIETLARRSGAQVSTESDRYDVLLMSLDSSMPLPSSSEALSLLTPSTASICVIWTGKDSPRGTTSRLLRAGVTGVLPIDITPSRFRSALGAIQAGLQVIDPAFAREETRSHATTTSPEELTEREHEVLAMLAEGLSNKEISSRLSISTHTVKFHISSILGKMGATSRTEAVSIGIRSGRVTI